jgi:hypothetical protein
VLGRLWACAHHSRWHPDSIIVRWTPDDPFKDADSAYANAFYGDRDCVERAAECFTLAQLDDAHRSIPWNDKERREHITHALFPGSPPPAPPSGRPWTIDTLEDYDACKRWLEKHGGPVRSGDE